ncbi:hypothetical protein IU486_28305 [Streptomyces gardneri]|nr:hypothetical protein [Streptomyces gardneri]
MVTTASSPDSFATAAPVTGLVSRSQAVASAAGSSTDRRDQILMPLRIPALIAGVVLICLGLTAVASLQGWIRDYGGVLVAVAYLQYMSLAAALTAWGVRMSRNRSR